MQEFFYNGVKRLDWGFGNPNITAGLIATLLMAVWGLAFIHRWGFWPALVGFTALGVCLIQTASRGGLVAAILGGVVLVACLRRPWPRGRWIPIVVALVLLGSYAVWHGVATRYGKGIVEEDASVSNRWLIYRMAPAMMVDAPGGWGHKRAAEAYHHFYQPVGSHERYGSLVSSHLTWMVEWGWWGRIGYVAGWFAVFAVCLPSERRRWYAIPFATWVAFCTAVMFTTMANRWWLWLAPGILFLGVLGTRVALRDWPSGAWWAWAGAGTLSTLAGLLLWGSMIAASADPPIMLRSGWVRVGKELAGGKEGTTWITAPDPAVLGKAYGQRLRKHVSQEARSDSFLVEWYPGGRHLVDLAPGPSDTVVFSGKGAADLEGEWLAAAGKAAGWIFLNPDEPARPLTEALESSLPIRIYWGEFHRGRTRSLWDAIALKFEQILLEEISGSSKYLDQWEELLRKDTVRRLTLEF